MGKGIVKLGEGNWAVKDGNLLAAKETNGRFKNAEFTVARGTRATYVGRDGLIKESNLQDVNLVTNGDFSNGSTDWEEEGSSEITVGTYQGRENVARININNTSTSSRIRQPFTYVNGATYKIVVNVYLESGSFRVDSSDTFVSADFLSTTSTGSWQTLTAYFTAISSGSNYIWLRSLSEVSEFYVQDISVKEVKTDTPRIDFTDNTDGHLLLEPQSTNLIPYSEDFEQWAEEVNIDVTNNSTTSPDGTQNAAKLQLTGSSGGTDGKISINVSPSATTHTFSIFAKKGNHDYIYIWMNMSVGSNITRWIDLNDGSVNEVGGTATVTTTSFSNDWWKIEYTFDATNLSKIKLEVADDGVSTGTGGDNIYVWGAQLEALPHPTSYIPTNGSTVTRDADTCNNSGEAIDFNSEEGVLYAEIAALADDLTRRIITITDGTLNSIVKLEYKNTSNQIEAVLYDGDTECLILHTLSDETEFNKIAFKYKQDDFSLFVNGIKVGTDTSGAVFTPNTLNDLSFYQGSSNNLFGKVKAIRVYKEALSDTDLENLTS
jgi:hypothetical protein